MTPGLSGLYQDVSFAIRMLVKDRRFTVAAVVALALAIGVNSSVFKLVNAALIRDLPFDRADRLVSIGWTDGMGLGAISYPDYVEWRDATTAFEGLAATTNTVMNVSEPDLVPERFRGTFVSANTLRVLRVKPMFGRDFLPDDERPGAPAVVMLGYGTWQHRYNGDPGVIGRLIRVNDVQSTIVGVMPPRFTFPFNNEMWQPLSVATFTANAQRDRRTVQAFGRLADGVDLARARTELETLAARHARPTRERPERITALTMREDSSVRSPMFITFMGAVALVLLIACANLANLLLARGTGRSREIAIRTSLGATRWRIVRQLLIECFVIAVVAGVLGAVLSIYGANTMAVAFDPLEPGARPGSTRPFWIDLSMDGTTYLYIGLLCMFATLACGLVPALVASKADVNEALKDGGRGAGGGVRVRWWSTTFVVAEIALTLILLSSAGLLWRSFVDRYSQDMVIDTSNIVTASIGLPVRKYSTPELRQRFYSQLEAQLASIPAVSATIANVPPFGFGAPSRELRLEGTTGDAPEKPRVFLVQTGDRYFETVGLRVVRGREFSASDGLASPEGAIIDERFAAKFFPDGDAIGRRIQLTTPVNRNSPTATTPPAPWLTVVGVAPTLPQFGPPSSAQPLVYVPIGAIPLQGPGAMIVRGGSDIGRVTTLMREEVHRLDADLPLYAIETVEDALARSRLPVRLVGTWFSVIALIALVLATVGVYALTAHGVAQRTQEIGVRVALGAQTAQVLWLFLRRAIVQLAIGLTLGVAGAVATGQLLQSYLGEVNARDPLTLILSPCCW